MAENKYIVSDETMCSRTKCFGGTFYMAFYTQNSLKTKDMGWHDDCYLLIAYFMVTILNYDLTNTLTPILGLSLFPLVARVCSSLSLGVFNLVRVV